jgi:hypothetical protein
MGNEAESEGGGLGNAADVHIRDTIIDGNVAPKGANCKEGPTSEGGNVADSACGLSFVSDAPVFDPMVGPLEGTPIPALEPLAGSPALDRAVGACPPEDARGIPRPQGAGCDSGAAERPVPVPVVSPPAKGSGGGGNAGGGVPAAVPMIGSVQTRSATVTVAIGCQGLAGQVCDGDTSLYTTEHKRASRVLSLSRVRPHMLTTRVLVGHLHFTLHGGQTVRLAIPLNATGRALLRRFGRLPAKLVVTFNTPSGRRTLATTNTTIKAPRRHKH